MAKVQQEVAEKCTLLVLEEWQVSQQHMMRNSKGSEYEKIGTEYIPLGSYVFMCCYPEQV